MNNIEYKTENSDIVLFLYGRMDSTNAEEYENEIRKALSSAEHTSVTLDAENLSYISSAGLRVMLRLCKSEKIFQIVNASAEVYEIFEMTGFTEIMTVKKAYRQLSVDGCKVIGTGATGEVYRLNDEIIVKVYNESNALSDIHRERELARKAFVLGIPTAIPFDVVRVGKKFGSVFELLKAKSLGEMIIGNPEKLDSYIDLSVGLMKTIHSTKDSNCDLPPIKDRAVSLADYLENRMPEEKAAKFRRMAEAIPDIANMVHGDLHIKNIMVQDGELILIDMDTLSHGHPVFEFAALFNAYIGYSEIDKNNTMEFFGISYETGERILTETLRRYLGTDDEAYISAVFDKIRLLGYAFLYRDFTCSGEKPVGDEKRRVEAYMNHILTLLDTVDSFDF